MTNLVIGLVATMTANVLLGSSLATIKSEFDKEKLYSGIFKGISITLGVMLMYLASYFNPNILVATINDTSVNLIEGIKVIFIAGIMLYGYQDLIKLKDLIKVKVDIVDEIRENQELEEDTKEDEDIIIER